MKTKHLTWGIVALAIGQLFAACSKDYEKEIVGEWQRTALYWTYSGSPNASSNYSGGGPMAELYGTDQQEIFFYEDKTGMIAKEWEWVRHDGSGSIEHDTMHFTYTVDNDGGGTITPVAGGQKATWTTTYSIQDLGDGKMTIYEKQVAENHQDLVGDTTPYTRVHECFHHCKKK